MLSGSPTHVQLRSQQSWKPSSALDCILNVILVDICERCTLLHERALGLLGIAQAAFLCVELMTPLVSRCAAQDEEDARKRKVSKYVEHEAEVDSDDDEDDEEDEEEGDDFFEAEREEVAEAGAPSADRMKCIV